jgi:hypothetical protein
MPAPNFQYIDCEIPEGMSIREWRHERAQTAARRRRLRSFVIRARRAFAF